MGDDDVVFFFFSPSPFLRVLRLRGPSGLPGRVVLPEAATSSGIRVLPEVLLVVVAPQDVAALPGVVALLGFRFFPEVEVLPEIPASVLPVPSLVLLEAPAA